MMRPFYVCVKGLLGTTMATYLLILDIFRDMYALPLMSWTEF
jgi:hypothetical protein